MADPKVWMPFFVADYLADTGHLGTIEHGAYLLLILHYWRTGKPLPSDEGQLRKIARMTPGEWADGRGVLLDFFDLDDGVYRHTRIDQELLGASERIEAKSRGGKAAAAKRWHNDAAANASAIAEQKHNDAPSPSPSPSPSPVPTQAQSPKQVRAPAARVVVSEPLPDWLPEEKWLAFVEMRQKIRAPLTGNAVRLAIGELEKLRASGQDPGGVLDQSVMRSWRGLFPIEAKNGHGRQSGEQGRGVRSAAATALAAIKVREGQNPGGGAQQRIAAPSAGTPGKPLVIAARPTASDAGGDHSAAGDSGHCFPKPSTFAR